MKKIFLLILFGVSFLFSNEYMTKIEPFEKYEIRSQTSGIVKFVNKDLESQFVKMNEVLIKINSKDEEIDLKKQNSSIAVQREIVRIKQRNYTAKNRISQMSRYEKEREKLGFLESKKELVLLQEEVRRLKNEISKKSLNVENRYIHKIYVNKGEYVTIGDKLYDGYDISKQKVSLFLTLAEVENLADKKVFVDGKLSDFRVHKISKIKDEIRVSRYKVEFIRENKKLENYFFDKIVKLELK